MMLEAHLRLGALSGDVAHKDLLLKTLGAYTLSLSQSGLGVAGWTRVALRAQGPFYEVVLAGEPGDVRAALEAAWRELNPTWAVRVDLPRRGASKALAELAPTLGSKAAKGKVAMAYVCLEGVCKAPTSSPATFKQQLLEGWLR